MIWDWKFRLEWIIQWCTFYRQMVQWLRIMDADCAANKCPQRFAVWCVRSEECWTAPERWTQPLANIQWTGRNSFVPAVIHCSVLAVNHCSAPAGIHCFDCKKIIFNYIITQIGLPMTIIYTTTIRKTLTQTFLKLFRDFFLAFEHKTILSFVEIFSTRLFGLTICEIIINHQRFVMNLHKFYYIPLIGVL